MRPVYTRVYWSPALLLPTATRGVRDRLKRAYTAVYNINGHILVFKMNFDSVTCKHFLRIGGALVQCTNTAVVYAWFIAPDAAMLCTSKVVKREMHCSDVVGQTHTELMASVQYSPDPSFFSRVRVVSKNRQSGRVRCCFRSLRHSFV